MVMSERLGVERFFDQGQKREAKYEWLKAAESYKSALNHLPPNEFFEVGSVYERLGYAFYRAAMQAANSSEFEERMGHAVSDCEKARAFYAKLSAPKGTPLMFRCDAMIELGRYWLEPSMSERRKHLGRCWQSAVKALELFKESSAARDYGVTYNRFAASLLLTFFAEWDYPTRRKLVTEAVENGEQAVKFLSTLGEIRELAVAYVKIASFREMLGFYFLDLDERKAEYGRALDCWLKANELSEEAAHVELLDSFAMAMLENPDWEWGTDKTLANLEKALGYSRKTRDNLKIGLAQDWLSFHMLFRAEICEDTSRRIQLTQKALQYAESAKRSYSSIRFISPLWGALWAEYPLATFYFNLAACAIDLDERRDLLEKARKASIELLSCVEASTYPEMVMYAHHVFSDVLSAIAYLETKPSEKRRLLEEAMKHSSYAVRIIEQFIPYYYWKRGKMQNSLADIKSELANLTEDYKVKRSLLEEAIREKESTVKLAALYVSFWEDIGPIPALVSNLAEWQCQHGVLLSHFGELTSNSEYLKKAVQAFGEAAESFEKLSLFSHMAQCYWKTAQTYDILEDHIAAAESFDIASKYFRISSKSISQLSQFYQDCALYMQAWAEIERAKHCHKTQNYRSAQAHFEKVSEICKSLKQWNYLASNYQAWAAIEKAEDLSRKEQSEKALKVFAQAIELFDKTKKSLQAQRDRIESLDEKQMAVSMVKAASFRIDYCRGRIALEEAKILDRKGDHYSSSQRYSVAAVKFEEMNKALESRQYRSELKLILTLCLAWQKMTGAEAESSLAMYVEASRLFEQAKEFSTNEKTKMLALGHSRLCKALAAGIEFVDSRDKRLHAITAQHLAAAGNYYLKAGFRNATEHAKGIELLFDAYAEMDEAKKERDPEKKARLYMMAKKVLESSAESFLKAGHLEKRGQVFELLKKVGEEQALALSLSEVLHASSIVTSASSFTAPNPTYERAVGLEKFEHANVQSMLVAPKEVTAGEMFEIRLDMANVAKEPGLLVRIDDFASSTLEISETVPKYNWQGSSINMKCKQLEPQKIESIVIRVTALESGIAHLSPKIVYIDGHGNFKTCQPDPVTLTVYPLGEFQFKTHNAQKVFEFLAKAFVEDYMKKRLPLERSGWRTLMQIVRNADVSKSSIYGTEVHRGPCITELEGRGIVEVRVFSGERGRGGKITKTRIAYEKDIVKRYIDQRVMKIKEK